MPVLALATPTACPLCGVSQDTLACIHVNFNSLLRAPPAWRIPEHNGLRPTLVPGTVQGCQCAESPETPHLAPTSMSAILPGCNLCVQPKECQLAPTSALAVLPVCPQCGETRDHPPACIYFSFSCPTKAHSIQKASGPHGPHVIQLHQTRPHTKCPKISSRQKPLFELDIQSCQAHTF